MLKQISIILKNIFFLNYSAMHWILSPEPPKITSTIPLVEDLLTSQEFIRSNKKTVWLQDNLQVTADTSAQVSLLKLVIAVWWTFFICCHTKYILVVL